LASDGDPSRASRHYGALARGAGLPLPIRHSAHVRLTLPGVRLSRVAAELEANLRREPDVRAG